ITGSAWVISADGAQVVLIHHKKLKKWMQPGGHSDGNPYTLEVAKREAIEETGLNDIKEISEDFFDLDIHEIPERGNEPAHLHYDARFLFRVSREHQLLMNEEVSDLKWFPVSEVLHMKLEASVERMALKHQERLK
ncbi:MAG: NUDIX hydrolase, partial [uncultured bacterium]